MSDRRTENPFEKVFLRVGQEPEEAKAAGQNMIELLWHVMDQHAGRNGVTMHIVDDCGGGLEVELRRVDGTTVVSQRDEARGLVRAAATYEAKCDDDPVWDRIEKAIAKWDKDLLCITPGAT